MYGRPIENMFLHTARWIFIKNNYLFWLQTDRNEQTLFFFDFLAEIKYLQSQYAVPFRKLKTHLGKTNTFSIRWPKKKVNERFSKVHWKIWCVIKSKRTLICFKPAIFASFLYLTFKFKNMLATIFEEQEIIKVSFGKNEPRPYI